MTPKALSREIKFRAWDRIAKKMREHPQADDEHTNLNYTILDCQKNNYLMQYTGLHDRNGKEIWEGDLVELENWEPKRYEVVFNRGGFCLKFGEGSHFYPDIKYAEDSVVVGNIYELTKENK